MPDAISHHAALLAAADQPRAGERYSVEFLAAKVAALRAVLEVHRPVPFLVSVSDPDAPLVALCHGCSHGRWASPIIAVGWFDCLTIKAIGGALGVDLNG